MLHQKKNILSPKQSESDAYKKKLDSSNLRVIFSSLFSDKQELEESLRRKFTKPKIQKLTRPFCTKKFGAKANQQKKISKKQWQYFVETSGALVKTSSAVNKLKCFLFI